MCACDPGFTCSRHRVEQDRRQVADDVTEQYERDRYDDEPTTWSMEVGP